MRLPVDQLAWLLPWALTLSVMASHNVAQTNEAASSRNAWGVAPGTPLEATSSDGRVIRGEFDPRSTPDRLWLTVRAGDQVSISSLLEREQIARVVMTTGDNFTDVLSTTTGLMIPSGGKTESPLHERHVAPENRRTRASSMTIRSEPIFLDADSDIDGVSVAIQTANAHGAIVRKGGVATVRLDVYSIDVHDRVALEKSETWTRRLSTEDSTIDGEQILRLPFRQIDLSALGDLYVVGVASVTLRVPGEQALHATAQVPLQAPLRVPQQQLPLQPSAMSGQLPLGPLDHRQTQRFKRF